MPLAQSTFDNPEWFYRHVEAHSLCYEYKAVGKDNHVVLCGWKGCTCTFKDRCKLREHLRSHTQEKVVACPTCGGMFANNTKFLDHIRRQTSLDPLPVLSLFQEVCHRAALAGPYAQPCESL